jgi:hydrogenase expression/formation protein HypE
MLEGKLTNEQLKKMVFAHLSARRSEVIARGGIGHDCAAVDTRGEICVLTTDPITAADAEMGALALYITCNDLAAFGARPLSVLATLLAPPSAALKTVENLVIQMEEAAAELDVEMVGGHTEVTNAVNRIVISATAMGTCRREEMILPGGAREGDTLVMTKWAGLEGTTIIAQDHAGILSEILSAEELHEARSLRAHINAVPDGLTGAACGADAMHDVTEGGLLGAAWEMAEAAGAGLEIYADRVPLLPVTRKICAELGLDPLRLISSGCMLIAHPKPDILIAALDEKGIAAHAIGRFCGHEKTLFSQQKRTVITAPESDEIYKIKKT